MNEVTNNETIHCDNPDYTDCQKCDKVSTCDTVKTEEQSTEKVSDNMLSYLGTKQIRAKQMTRGEYNNLRGWTIPTDEDASEEGYLVEYVPDGKPNHPEFKGYISWSPKQVFEKSYYPTNGLSYGMMLEVVKAGNVVTRQGAVVKDKEGNTNVMFSVFMRPSDQVASTVAANFKSLPFGIKKLLSSDEEGTIRFTPYLCMLAGNTIVNGWTPTMDDMLATDWIVLNIQ